MASFRSAEAFLEPQIGFLRYIPASALTPLFLLWLGIDEAPKIALIVVGTVFFNILMIADVARAVPQELVDAVLHARRRPPPGAAAGDPPAQLAGDHRRGPGQPGRRLADAGGGRAARRQEGLAFRVVRAQRFRSVDTMFAVLIVFGLIGLVSDLALRQLRKRTAPWSEGSR